MATYVKFDDLSGDATDKDYPGYSRLERCNLSGVGTGIQNSVGTAEIPYSAPSFSTIQVVKTVDSVSPNLMAASWNGEVFKQVKIITQRGSVYYHTTLGNVRVSHYCESHTGSTSPKESFALTYTTIEKRIDGKTADGQPMAPVSIGYNLESMKEM